MSFCIACRRSVRDTFQLFTSRVLPVIVIAALLSPAVFVLFSETAEASSRKPRKTVTAPPSAPPERFIIGAQPSNPILTILAVEAFSTMTSSFMAMFADENAEVAVSVARTSVRALSTTENTESTEDTANLNIETETETETHAPPPQPASIVDFDFDNDGKTDIGRWKPGTSEFEIDPSGGGANLVYDIGSSTSKFVPGDFNGDGNVDAAVFDSGTWTYKTSPGASSQTFSFGQSGDIPMPADYNGDGTTDAAVFRPSTNVWWILPSGGSYYSLSFGAAGDVPVTGDFDGDGEADQAVFRPSTGVWHINGSQAGYYGSGFGLSSDVPVPADYDGDGKTDVSVYRGSTGTSYVQTSGTGPDITQVWGNYGDQPVPGDYDGDNKADLAVWRPSTGVWYIAKSSGGYEYHTLGVPGDRAVPSAFIKQIGGEVAPYELAKARLAPRNATGGTDLYSQNFSWGTSLVGLPGRAGLNAGFGMSYNSLVWTKEGSNVHFDTNYDNISPGFRFGFPTIEAPYYIEGGGGETSDPYFAYIMVSPSGARTEFRQIGASEFFETADSSYLQLKTKVTPDPNQPVEEISLTVRGTDGTQMSYTWIAGAFRCTKILDRNGNYITIDHSEYGQLTKVTDTLGREINVNYSEDLYPISITQTWKADNGLGSNVTHTWATFGYANVTLNPTWNTAITSTGPPVGTILKVLEKVTYPDQSFTKFSYNTYGQVSKIENIAADLSTHILNYVETNLSNPGSNLLDVPRLGETRTWVENFNNGNETVVTNTMGPGHQVTDITGAAVTAALIRVEMLDHPTENVTIRFVGQSGWMEGLPIRVDDYAVAGNGLELMRSSWTKWTQDDVNSADVQNPRVTETKIGDGVNLKRSTIDYLLYPSTTVSQFGLVEETRTYAADQTTVLKRSEIDYNFATAYTDRRIIGLPAEIRSYGWNDVSSNLELGSKVTYGYDEENFAQEANQIIAPIRHDTANHGSSFIAGRGNLTSVTRHDVLSQSSAVTSKTRYDIAGSVVSKLDPLGRKVRLEYTDVFNDSSTPGTFAYPTRVYDPANNFSEVKYRFDIGANVWAKSPAPAGNTDGKETERLFDNIGRLSKETVVNNGAYTRYEYSSNGIQSKVFSTIIDTNANGADSSDEVLSETWSDGAGRTRMSRTEHPGSIGGYSGSLAEYDLLGRVKRSTVPTEIDNNWNPAGDDDRGMNGSDYIWLWNSKEYDWMGRTTRTINTDGTDTLASYEGCGCAGGQITTIKGEEIIETDWQGNNPQSLGRRSQKIHEDILGRAWKTETLNWNGTAYLTTQTSFNGRDQDLTVTQTEASTSINQLISMTYDGHGRLKTKHIPAQDAGKYFENTYYADDKVATFSDGRGAATTYIYNGLGLVDELNYSIPATPENAGVHVPQDVEYTYDNVGNRIQMTDESGTTTYAYDELSQMVSETKQFNGLTNSYSLGYAYELGGQLKSVTNPGGTAIGYGLDKIGRLTGVIGSGFTHYSRTWNGSTPVTTSHTISQIADSIQYRAWGAIKHTAFQDGRQYDITFDNRLRPYEYTMPGKLEKRYSYFADGQLSFVKDLLDNRSDRYFSYDQMGRIAKAYGGYIARGEQSSGPNNPSYYNQFVPIKNDYVYNAFSNPVIRKEANSTSYRTDIEFQYHQVDMQRNYVNNRSPNGVRSWDKPWAYDADGRLIEDGNLSFDPYHTIGYDAAGSARKMKARDGGVIDEKTSVYDGNRQAAKEAMYVSVTTVDENGNTLPPVETTTHKYFLRSTPLRGSLIGLINENGSIGNLYVSAGGNRIATYSPISGTYSKFRWEHSDSHGISGYNSSYDQKQYSASYPNEDLTLPGKSESDPHGREISGLPQLSELSGSGGGYYGGPSEIAGGMWDNFNCTLDGVNTSCGWAIQFLSQNGGSPVYEAPPDQVASVWDNASRSFVRLPYSTTSTSERGLTYSRRGSRGWLPSGLTDDPLIIPDIPDGCIPGPGGSIICTVTVRPEPPEPLVINIATVGFRVDTKPQNLQDDELEAALRKMAGPGYVPPPDLGALEHWLWGQVIPSCDETLTSVFGDANSLVAGSGKDVRNGLYHDRMTNAEVADTNIRNNTPSSWPHTFGRSAHAFARSDSTRLGFAYGNVFVPADYASDWSTFTSDGAWFYNPKANLTILVMHINPNRVKPNLLRRNRNSAGSVLVGVMTSGGGSPGYIHAHLEVHRGRGVPNADRRRFPDEGDREIENQRLRDKTRVFFPDVFCPR